MCTKAGWSDIFQALTNDQPPDCDPTLVSPSSKGDCGDTPIATLFLLTYVIISFLVVVRISKFFFLIFSLYYYYSGKHVYAVISENFSQAQEDVQQVNR